MLVPFSWRGLMRLVFFTESYFESLEPGTDPNLVPEATFYYRQERQS